MSAHVSVLLVTHSYPPVLGGSEIEAQRVCSALIRRGHRVRVLCAGGPPMPNQRDWTDPAGVPVTIIGNGVPGRWRDHVFALEVARYIVQHRSRFDTVYFLMQGLHLATGLLAARLAGLPVVMKFSGSSIITSMTQSRLGRLELDWLDRWAKSIMVLNDGMVAEAVDAGFERERLLWMPNPVDVHEFAPVTAAEKTALRERLQIPPASGIVLFCGRMSPEKNLSPLILAFKRVVEQQADSMLVLVGDGPERPSLEKLVDQTGTGSNVRFIGRVEASEIPQWLQVADVFALVSRVEGFPCSLVEAMSVGLPAVVSDIPANRQLIEAGVHGHLVPVDDREAIASALLDVLKNEGFRHRAGKAARQLVVESFSTERVVGIYEAMFDRVRRG